MLRLLMLKSTLVAISYTSIGSAQGSGFYYLSGSVSSALLSASLIWRVLDSTSDAKILAIQYATMSSHFQMHSPLGLFFDTQTTIYWVSIELKAHIQYKLKLTASKERYATSFRKDIDLLMHITAILFPPTRAL